MVFIPSLANNHFRPKTNNVSLQIEVCPLLLACWGLTQVESYLAKQIPTLLAVSALAHEVRTEASLEAVWGMLEPSFYTFEMPEVLI